jgi:hypothetical protein
MATTREPEPEVINEREEEDFGREEDSYSQDEFDDPKETVTIDKLR